MGGGRRTQASWGSKGSQDVMYGCVLLGYPFGAVKRDTKPLQARVYFLVLPDSSLLSLQTIWNEHHLPDGVSIMET